MRKTTALATLFAALALSAASAPAASPPSDPTTITIVGSSSVGDDAIVAGLLSSPRGACRGSRTVKLFAHYPDGSRQLIDIATSSGRGAFFTGGNFAGADGGFVRVTKRKIGSRRHPRICRPATKSLGP